MLQCLETQDGQTYHFCNSNKSRNITNDDSGWNVDLILIYITARTSMAPDIFRNPHTDSLSCFHLYLCSSNFSATLKIQCDKNGCVLHLCCLTGQGMAGGRREEGDVRK